MKPENSLPLTLEEHRELGREMTLIVRRMRTLCDLVVGVYGPQNPAAFNFLRAMEAFNRLNQEMQNQAARDLPGYPLDDLYR